MSRNKKIILFALVAILVVAVALYFYFSSEKNNVENDARTKEYPKIQEYEQLGLNQNQVMDFNNSGQAARFNPNNKSVEIYNEETGGFDPVAEIENEATYVEISPDKKRVLYSTTNDPELIFSENVYFFDTDSADKKYEIKGVFSPRFMPDGSLIYQSFSNGGSQLKIVKDSDTRTVSLPDEGEKIIEIIDSKSVVIYDFQTDLTKGSAWLVDIVNQRTTQFAQGEGLKIKTVAGSSYLGIQETIGEETLVSLYNYKTKKTVAEIKNISLDDIDWRTDEIFYYFDNGAIYKSSFSLEQEKNEIQKIEGPILQLKVLENLKIFALSLDRLDIIDPK